MKKTPTPGPYQVNAPAAADEITIIDKAGNIVADVPHSEELGGHAQALADAHLLAASWDMAALCRELLDASNITTGQAHLLRMAINKAAGRP
jgi:hypothetical protein